MYNILDTDDDGLRGHDKCSKGSLDWMLENLYSVA